MDHSRQETLRDRLTSRLKRVWEPSFRRTIRRFREFGQNGLKNVLDLFYSSECLICRCEIDERELGEFKKRGEAFGDSVFSSIYICSRCRRAIVVAENKLCRRCGGTRFVYSDSPLDCKSCSGKYFRFRQAITLGAYEGILRDAVLEMKRQTSGVFASATAKLLYQTRRELLEATAVDLIVPVPMFFWRKKFRGVNSTEIIAAELSRRLKTPVDLKLVRRNRSTRPQSSLPADRRLKNVLGAFSVVERKKNILRGKRVLLVDDVLTTGATCNEISRVLLENGADDVFVAVLARAEGKD